MIFGAAEAEDFEQEADPGWLPWGAQAPPHSPAAPIVATNICGLSPVIRSASAQPIVCNIQSSYVRAAQGLHGCRCSCQEKARREITVTRGPRVREGGASTGRIMSAAAGSQRCFALVLKYMPVVTTPGTALWGGDVELRPCCRTARLP
jgi:hypothetical protein